MGGWFLIQARCTFRNSSHSWCCSRSTIRSKMEPRVPAWESPYPFGCMWAILPDVEGEFTKTGTLYQRISSGKADKMLGFLPTGRTPTQLEQDSESPELVSLFWSLVRLRGWRELYRAQLTFHLTGNVNTRRRAKTRARRLEG